jgi:hypothetical protein
MASKPSKTRLYGTTKPYGLENDQKSGRRCLKVDVLVLDYSDPTRLLSVTGTQPYVIGGGETHFDGEMGSKSIRICLFFVIPCAKVPQAALGLAKRDRPLCSVLRVLKDVSKDVLASGARCTDPALHVEYPIPIVNADRVRTHKPASESGRPCVNHQEIPTQE